MKLTSKPLFFTTAGAECGATYHGALQVVVNKSREGLIYRRYRDGINRMIRYRAAGGAGADLFPDHIGTYEYPNALVYFFRPCGKRMKEVACQ
jgi:hypothetical protein